MTTKLQITDLPVLTPFTGELPEYVLADLKDWHYKIRVADIQNKVAIEEFKNLKEMLEGFCDDCKTIRANVGSDWFNGRYGAYSIVINYLQARIDSLEKMA